MNFMLDLYILLYIYICYFKVELQIVKWEVKTGGNVKHAFESYSSHMLVLAFRRDCTNLQASRSFLLEKGINTSISFYKVVQTFIKYA